MECVLLRRVSVQLAVTPLELVCKYFRPKTVLVCAFKVIGQMIRSGLRLTRIVETNKNPGVPSRDEEEEEEAEKHLFRFSNDNNDEP